MKTSRTLPFDSHVTEYEEWFEKYPHVFKTEVEAIRRLLPEIEHPEGLEIGVATGRFARALHIHHGIEPAPNMRQLALKRGVHAVNGVAENLPYRGLSFDFVLMNFCISYLEDPLAAFVEAWRVLRYGGSLIIGFLDKNSAVAKAYERRKKESLFYKDAHFYSTEELQEMLLQAGFTTFEYSQTLFHQPEKLSAAENTMPGYGQGSYVMLKAIKPSHSLQ